MHFEYPQVTFQVPTWVPFDHKNIFLFINWNTKQDQKSTRCDISYVFQESLTKGLAISDLAMSVSQALESLRNI